jgi:hypothetical protein
VYSVLRDALDATAGKYACRSLSQKAYRFAKHPVKKLRAVRTHLSGWKAAANMSCCKTVSALDTATGTAVAPDAPAPAPAATDVAHGDQILESCNRAAVTSSGRVAAIWLYAAALSGPSHVGTAAAPGGPGKELLPSAAAAVLLLLTTALLQLRRTAHSWSGN